MIETNIIDERAAPGKQLTEADHLRLQLAQERAARTVLAQDLADARRSAEHWRGVAARLASESSAAETRAVLARYDIGPGRAVEISPTGQIVERP